MKRYGLRDDPFGRIESLPPGHPGRFGRTSAIGNRLFAEAVIWKFRSGVPWRDVPKRFGGWRNTRTRLLRWAASGVCYRFFKGLSDNPDAEYAMIDVAPLECHWSK